MKRDFALGLTSFIKTLGQKHNTFYTDGETGIIHISLFDTYVGDKHITHIYRLKCTNILLQKRF